MARTQLNAKQLLNGTVQREDMDIITTGKSMITQVVAGTDITISSTGADSGTGVVTINKKRYDAEIDGDLTGFGWTVNWNPFLAGSGASTESFVTFNQSVWFYNAPMNYPAIAHMLDTDHVWVCSGAGNIEANWHDTGYSLAQCTQQPYLIQDIENLRIKYDPLSTIKPVVILFSDDTNKTSKCTIAVDWPGSPFFVFNGNMIGSCIMESQTVSDRSVYVTVGGYTEFLYIPINVCPTFIRALTEDSTDNYWYYSPPLTDLVGPRVVSPVIYGGETNNSTLTLKGSTQTGANAGSVLLGDSSVYNEVTKRLGINTLNPTEELDVNGSGIIDGLFLRPIPEPPVGGGALSLIAGAGNLLGTYYYYVVYLSGTTQTMPSQIATIINVTAGNQQVQVTVPVSSDIRVTGRALYRTKAGGFAAGMFFLTNIMDNVTSIYVDNIADTSLTGTADAVYGLANNTTALSWASNQQLVMDPKNIYLGQHTMTKMLAQYTTIVGNACGNSMTAAASKCILMGYRAGYQITSGGSNIYLGYRAGYANTTGVNNIAIGVEAIMYPSGSDNVSIGHQTMWGQNMSMTVTSCVAVGSMSMFGIRDGATNNTAIGANSGRSLATGTGNTFLGYNAGHTGQTNAVTNSTAIGASAVTSKSNQVVVGDANVVETVLRGNVIQGGSRTETKEINTPYTLTVLDYSVFVSGTTAITLPSAIGCDGQIFAIKKADATGIATVVASTTPSQQYIEGLVSIELADQYDSILVQSDNVGWVILSNTKAQTGGTVQEVTYAELFTLMDTDLLIPGQQYQFEFINSYRPKYSFWDDPSTVNTFHKGVPETFVITAVTTNSFSREALSIEYPQDIIVYDFLGTVFNDQQHGQILYREDTIRNISAHEDWRNSVCRRWADSLGRYVSPWSTDVTDANGTYLVIPDAEDYQDFPMFKPGSNYNNVHIARNNYQDLTERILVPLDICLLGTEATKLSIAEGADGFTFCGTVGDVNIGTCSSGLFYGNVDVYHSDNNVQQVIFTGGIGSCRHWGGFYRALYTGDRYKEYFQEPVSEDEDRTIISILYEDLKDLADAGTLQVGRSYRITDFRSRWFIRGSDASGGTATYGTGPVEQLVVTAESNTTLGILAKSDDYPDDVIHYVLEPKTIYKIDFPEEVEYYESRGADRGAIFYRNWVTRNISAGWDWRNVYSRWWETVPSNGIFEAESYVAGSAYVDYPFLQPEMLLSVECHNISVQSASQGSPKVAFTFVGVDSLYEIRFGTGIDECLIQGSMRDVFIEACCGIITRTGKVEHVSIQKGGGGCKFYSTAKGITYLSNAKSCTFEQAAENVILLSGVDGMVFTTPISNAIIGDGYTIPDDWKCYTATDILYADLVTLAGNFPNPACSNMTIQGWYHSGGTLESPIDSVLVSDSYPVVVGDKIRISGDTNDSGEYTVAVIGSNEGSKVLTVAEPVNFSGTNYSSTVDVIIPGNLVPGKKYRITDYKTIHRHWRDASSTINTSHPVEPLTVTAATPTTLHQQAISDTYPGDIIHYDINCSTIEGEQYGGITYRREPKRNIETFQDWRHSTSRLWETVLGNGIFMSLGQMFTDVLGVPTEHAYQDFHMFDQTLLYDDPNPRAICQLYIGQTDFENGDERRHDFTVFKSDAVQVHIERANAASVFAGPVGNLQHGHCSYITAYGVIDDVTVGEHCLSLVFNGNVHSSYFGATVCNIQIEPGASSGLTFASGFNRYSGTTFIVPSNTCDKYYGEQDVDGGIDTAPATSLLSGGGALQISPIILSGGDATTEGTITIGGGTA